MTELRFKNALVSVIYYSVFFTSLVIFCCVFGSVMSYFLDNQRDFILVIEIGLIIILSIWLIAIIAIILNPKIIVTDTEIKKCYGKKVKWCIKKEEIEACIYTRIRWYSFIVISSFRDEFHLQFKLNNTKLSKHFCSLSFYQIKKIQRTFNYPIKITE